MENVIKAFFMPAELRTNLMEALRDLQRLKDFVDILAHRIDADAAIFRWLDASDYSYPATFVSNSTVFSPAFFAEYDAGMVVSDPHVRFGLDRRLPSGTVYVCSDHFDAAAREADPYFSEFLPRHGIQWFAGYLATWDDRYSAGFGVARAPGRPPFGDEARSVMGAIAFWFEDWARAFVTAQQCRCKARALEAAFAAKADFALCVDKRGFNVWADDAAINALSRVRGAALRSEFWRPAGDGDGAALLKTAMAYAAANGGAPPETGDLALDDGRRFALTFRRVSAEGPDAPVEGFAACLVTGRAIAARGAAETDPQGVATLSARERAVAALVCEGLTNAKIAARLGVKQSTAETHLKRAYRKLGLNTKQQLAALYTEYDRSRRGA